MTDMHELVTDEEIEAHNSACRAASRCATNRERASVLSYLREQVALLRDGALDHLIEKSDDTDKAVFLAKTAVVVAGIIAHVESGLHVGWAEASVRLADELMTESDKPVMEVIHDDRHSE